MPPGRSLASCRWRSCSSGWSGCGSAAAGAGRRLEIGDPKARNALIAAGRIEGGDVQRDRPAEPAGMNGVIGEIVVGQRVDEGGEAGRLDRRDHDLDRTGAEMDLLLGQRVRAD